MQAATTTAGRPRSASFARPQPTAADLNGFASQQWLTEFLTVDGISSGKFFGNTKFKHGKMYGFVKETFADYDDARSSGSSLRFRTKRS